MSITSLTLVCLVCIRGYALIPFVMQVKQTADNGVWLPFGSNNINSKDTVIWFFRFPQERVDNMKCVNNERVILCAGLQLNFCPLASVPQLMQERQLLQTRMKAMNYLMNGNNGDSKWGMIRYIEDKIRVSFYSNEKNQVITYEGYIKILKSHKACVTLMPAEQLPSLHGIFFMFPKFFQDINTNELRDILINIGFSEDLVIEIEREAITVKIEDITKKSDGKPIIYIVNKDATIVGRNEGRKVGLGFSQEMMILFNHYMLKT